MRSFSSCLMFGLQAMAVAMGAESVPAAPAPLPYRVAARLSDTAELLTPSAVRLDGWLGHRIAINEAGTNGDTY